MRLFVLALVLALATASLLLGRAPVSAKQPAREPAYEDAVAKAQAILAQARAALGGEAKWKTLQSLTISGKARRVMGDRELAGEIQFDILMPDKIMKSEIMSPMQGIEITNTEVLNGAEIWTDQNSGGGHGGMVVMRRGGPGGMDTPEARERVNQLLRAEITRVLVGTLLYAPPASALTFTYAGEAEAPDGKADMLEVKGANNFTARLFLDQKSHRPLLLTYQGRKPRMVMMTGGGPPNEAELEKQMKEAQAQPPVEFQMRFSDYRDEGGLTFPHRIVKSVADEVNEEWELTKFKLNPALKPEKFEKKK